MTDWTELLGLPLNEAEEWLRAKGITMRVVFSAARADAPEDGTPRVVRCREGEMPVCRFPDDIPQ